MTKVIKGEYIYRTECGAIVKIKTFWSSGKVDTYTKTGENIKTTIGQLKKIY
jgi:hypothetical protein